MESPPVARRFLPQEMCLCDEAAVRYFHAGGGLDLIVPKVSNQEKPFI